MNIVGKKVVLKAIEQEDLKKIHDWSNDPTINYMLGGWHFPSSMQDQQRWFEGLSLNSNNQRFAIHSKQEGFIGVANLVDINWKDGNAFHGMLLGENSSRGKGYGTDTVMTIAKYAFEELGLNRLDTTIISNNEASLGLYINKCGWKQEGVKKDYYFRKNTRWDMIILGITASDFQEVAKANGY